MESEVVSARGQEGREWRWAVFLPIVLLLPAYVLAAKLGLRLAVEHPSATPVWPPTGIAIAAFILLGYRVWPLVLVGAFLVNFTTAGNLVSSVGIAIGNTLEGLVAAYLVNRFANGKFAFDRPPDAARFTLYAALLSTMISATIGVLSLAATGFAEWNEYGSIWLTWWLGDATGALIVAPPILVWAAHTVIKWNVFRAIEATLLLAILTFTCLAIFGAPLTTFALPFAQGFLCFPPLVWIAFRFYPRVATTATLITGTIVLVCTLTGRGPFAEFDAGTALFVAQAFTGVAAITTFVLSSATYERMIAELALRESENRFRTLADSSPAMVWMADSRARCSFLNRTWQNFTGRTEAQGLGHGWIECVHPDDVDVLIGTYRASYDANETLKADFRLRRADGVYCWVMTTGSPRFLASGMFAGFVGTCIDISERKRYEEELQKEALHDPLTGLPNRTLFLDRLGVCLAASKRDGSSRSCILFLDIDRFKLINDTLGHGVGDKFLIETGRRIQGLLRPGDTVARLAGDEFAVLLADVPDVRYGEAIAERIDALFRMPYRLGGEDVYSSASIGIALVNQSHSKPEDVIQDADTAMYRAKSLGRRRYQVYEGGTHKPIVETLRLEADLRRAIEVGALQIHYQPIFDLLTGTVSGFEALVRWEDEERGLLLPHEFIPIAEQTGLIADLDRIVLKLACEQMGKWHRLDDSTRRLTINVNVSARLFSQIDVAQAVEVALRDSGLDGCRLVLEITESVLMEDKKPVVDALNRIKALGVRIALDDFGTGYSSLGFLNSFPVDSVKIDRSFVGDLKLDGPGSTVASAIVELAHTLNLQVTAEGVETEEELQAVKSLKCEFAQGYLFGRPVPAEAVGPMLA